jgi:deoxyribose-phosphate aldolase
MIGRFLDLTNLSEGATEQDIIDLCSLAKENPTIVAGVCSWPIFADVIKNELQNTDLKTVCVLNFPHGHSCDMDNEIKKHKIVLQAFCDEIDVVFDYGYVKKTTGANSGNVLKTKDIFGKKTVKVILESGILSPYECQMAAHDAINSGADFLKTSTGKTAIYGNEMCNIGATPLAVKIMCNEIAHHYSKTKRKVGIKVSGGVKTNDQAQEYIEIVRELLGDEWLVPELFRIGIGTTSNLLNEWKTN